MLFGAYPPMPFKTGKRWTLFIYLKLLLLRFISHILYKALYMVLPSFSLAEKSQEIKTSQKKKRKWSLPFMYFSQSNVMFFLFPGQFSHYLPNSFCSLSVHFCTNSLVHFKLLYIVKDKIIFVCHDLLYLGGKHALF